MISSTLIWDNLGNGHGNRFNNGPKQAIINRKPDGDVRRNKFKKVALEPVTQGIYQ